MKRLFFIVIKIGICLLLYGLNIHFLWNYSGMRKKEKIENEAQAFFQVVVLTPQGAELFLDREELSAFIQSQKAYTYLIPPGEEQKVEEQIQASYRRKYHGKSFPFLKVEHFDAEHQVIELYMSGDPRDVTVWYEATDKKIVLKYQMVVGALSSLPYGLLAIGLVVAEYKGGKWLFRKVKNRQPLSNSENLT